jgi:hypothetical protein
MVGQPLPPVPAPPKFGTPPGGMPAPPASWYYMVMIRLLQTFFLLLLFLTLSFKKDELCQWSSD